jgi:uncharacterized protein (DUF305 family)
MKKTGRTALALTFALGAGIGAGSLAVRAHDDKHKTVSKDSPSGRMHAVMAKPMPHMNMTGDPDHDFAMMMVMHHKTALDMAQIEVKDGKDAKIKGMAQNIIDSQKKEIAEFEAWMKQHKAPAAHATH